MKKILITGGAGFIGSNFVRYFANKYPDYSLVVLDALTYAGRKENLNDVLDGNRVQFVEGFIQDVQLVDSLVKDVDGIINFAAETHVDRSILEAGSFIQTDVVGTFTLLEAARKYDVERFLQISTDEVYGSIEEGSFSETDALMPNSPYSASKSGGDLLVRAYNKTYGLPTLITRSSNNFGPWQYPEKLIPLFISNAIDDKPLPVYGDGLNVRDWIYVLDNCSALDVVFHTGRVGEVYNIGAGNEHTNIEITRLILKFLGKNEDLITFVTDRPGHDRRYSVTIDKVKALGWEQKYTFEEAMEHTVKWYVDNEAWWRSIKEKDTEFKTYYQKQYQNRS